MPRGRLDVVTAEFGTKEIPCFSRYCACPDLCQYDFKDDRTQWTAKGRAGDYEVFSGKNIGFDHTSPRFNYNQVFYGQSLKFDVPGPGQYAEHG